MRKDESVATLDSNIMSIVNCDDGFIDFSWSTVLGLDNSLNATWSDNDWNVSLIA